MNKEGLILLGLVGVWLLSLVVVSLSFLSWAENYYKHKYDDGFVVIEYNIKTNTWSSETYDAKRLYQLDNAQSYKE